MQESYIEHIIIHFKQHESSPVYSSHPENITECFISHFTISNHFPVCFTRKTNFKVIKNDHLTTSYHCFKKFDDILFLNDLQNDLNSFSANSSGVDEDFSTWHRIIMKHLNNHAPIKTKGVKHKRLPEWYTPEITLTQKLRDNSKRRKQWSEYKHYRNKIRDLIRSYFSESIINTKDSKFIWKHLHSINSPTTNSSKTLPDELIINGQKITNSENVAAKLNDYFSSITDNLNENSNVA